MKYLLLSLSVLLSVIATAQNTKDTANKIYTFVQQMPAPPYDLGTYIGQNLKYPDSARTYDIQGRVIIKFQVNEDGSISDCKVLKGIGGGCDEEALRVIGNMPRWKPGRQEGIPVKVVFTQPLTFALQDATPPPVAVAKDTLKPFFPYNINEYFQRNIRYPSDARDLNITGKVMVQFIVNEDGSISDCKVVKGLSADCNAEALRVIKNMPRWKPGKKDGRAVKVLFTQPVTFSLQ